MNISVKFDNQSMLNNSDNYSGSEQGAPRVLLVRPPQKFYNAKFPRGPRVGVPNGIVAIGSFLQRKGAKVKIYDALVEERFPENTKDEDLALFGASWATIRKIAKEFDPHVIGISNIFYETMEDSLTTATEVRKILPNATILVGGPNATTHDEHIIKSCPEVDFVCSGDGEDTTWEVLQYALGNADIKQIGGVVYRDPENTEKIVRTGQRKLPLDLDPLGEFDFSLIDLEKYFDLEGDGIMARGRFHYKGGERSISVVTSRGCPYACVFCSIHIHSGRKYRTYSPELVLNQLETLVNDYGVKHIHFEDDNLTLDNRRFMEILDGVLERGIKFTWDTPNGVHANTLTREMLVKMKKTGCVYLIVAVESGDQYVIDNIVKKNPMKISNVLDAFKIGAEIGLDLQAFYIIGFPGETIKQIHTTLDFALDGLKKYNVIPHMAMARADKGTDLYEIAMQGDYLIENQQIRNPKGVHIDRYNRHLISTEEFTPELLEKLNNKYHTKFFITIGLTVFKYCVLNPKITWRNLVYFYEFLFKLKFPLKDAIYLLFFTRLFYPRAMNEESGKEDKLWNTKDGRRFDPPKRAVTQNKLIST